MKHDCPMGGDLENTCEKTAPAPRPSVELLSMPLAFLATAQYWKLHPPPPTWDTGSRHPARRGGGPWVMESMAFRGLASSAVNEWC